jgi:hypothetical protein
MTFAFAFKISKIQSLFYAAKGNPEILTHANLSMALSTCIHGFFVTIQHLRP